MLPGLALLICALLNNFLLAHSASLEAVKNINLIIGNNNDENNESSRRVVENLNIYIGDISESVLKKISNNSVGTLITKLPQNPDKIESNKKIPLNLNNQFIATSTSNTTKLNKEQLDKLIKEIFQITTPSTPIKTSSNKQMFIRPIPPNIPNEIPQNDNTLFLQALNLAMNQVKEQNKHVGPPSPPKKVPYQDGVPFGINGRPKLNNDQLLQHYNFRTPDLINNEALLEQFKQSIENQDEENLENNATSTSKIK